MGANFNNRGLLYDEMGSYDLAIADFDRAIQLNPNEAAAYNNRGASYRGKGDYGGALADHDQAVGLAPAEARAFSGRAWTHYRRGDYSRAKIDASRAIELDPKCGSCFGRLAHAVLALGDSDRALAEFTHAIGFEPNDPTLFVGRAAAYEKRALIDLALVDYRKALVARAASVGEREAHETAKRRIAALTTPVASAPNLVAGPIPARRPSSSIRVALVIGNSQYAHAPRLPNPNADARSIATALRQLGFASVVERNDLDLAQFSTALKEFSDVAQNSDWAVVYFAGHGLELNGVSYLLPVDARLARDTHVADEAVSLDRLLSKVEGAKRFRLVILDACRSNPFAGRMTRSAGLTRAIGRGLARVEPDSGTLVAYAAKHGTEAEDGEVGNSPFALALVKHLATPGLDVRIMFGRVRDAVLRSTINRQEPFTYGSLPGDLIVFKEP